MLHDKKILLTGMTGQVGASLALGLAPHNEVWGLARYGREGAWEEVAAMGCKPVRGDYSSGDFTGVPDDFDYVVHVGADCKPASSNIGIHQNAEGTGLLFHHARKARGFIYVSTTGVYFDNPDPYYRYREDDRLGGHSAHAPYYGVSKVAGEAVTRTLSRILEVPATILRLNVSYGKGGTGGLPGRQLSMLLAGEPITIPANWPSMHVPIHEDDMVASIGPCFEAATVGATVLNWGGDDMVSSEEWVTYMADLIGVEPNFARTQDRAIGSRAADPTKRQATLQPFRVDWRAGMRKMIADRHPALALREPA